MNCLWAEPHSKYTPNVKRKKRIGIPAAEDKVTRRASFYHINERIDNGKLKVKMNIGERTIFEQRIRILKDEPHRLGENEKKVLDAGSDFQFICILKAYLQTRQQRFPNNLQLEKRTSSSNPSSLRIDPHRRKQARPWICDQWGRRDVDRKPLNQSGETGKPKKLPLLSKYQWMHSPTWDSKTLSTLSFWMSHMLVQRSHSPKKIQSPQCQHFETIRIKAPESRSGLFLLSWILVPFSNRTEKFLNWFSLRV